MNVNQFIQSHAIFAGQSSHVAGVGRQLPTEQAQQRGLAAPVGAHHAGPAGLQAEAEVFEERHGAAVGERHPVELEKGHEAAPAKAGGLRGREGRISVAGP